MKQLIAFLLFGLLAFGSRAADVLWNIRQEGSSIPGATMLVEDGNYNSLNAGTFVDVNAHAYIRLGLGENAQMSNTGDISSLRINLKITPYDNFNTALPYFNETLEVAYSITGNAGITVDAEDYRMQGVYKFKVEVLSIEKEGVAIGLLEVPNFLYLEAGISAERYYDLDYQAVPQCAVNYVFYDVASGGQEIITQATLPFQTNIFSNDIELVWDYIEGAEYYDVEWTWVDNYSNIDVNTQLSTSDVDLTENEFQHNSTRVRTGAQSYRITNAFDKGFLVFRIRGVGRWLDAPNKDKYGKWSSENGVAKDKVADWPNVIEIVYTHELGSKNWQYQATYAEEGKKKEVSQYFDGSLRSRQTVTRINSDNHAVAGETVYDNEGRGVIQILPAPQNTATLRYYPNLNQNTSGVPYSHQDFDWTADGSGTECDVTGAGALGTASGAGKYYSAAAHVNDNDWQQYVPESNGYAFTQVEYTPDNTGRIRNQSGVGPEHKIGSGHEIYYYYLQPSQEELNRLFGYKVGFKSRYKKNMVVDANGQVSVSYLDAQGRVIATAMAGSNVTDFSALDEEQNGNHGQVSTNLLNNEPTGGYDSEDDDNDLFSTGRFGAVEDGLRFHTELGVADNATIYNFKYTAYFEAYEETCDVQGINFPFVYDLTLSLRDDCGNAVFSHTYEALDASMFDQVTNQFEQEDANVTLQKGSYTLYKEIKVNEASLNAYKQLYLNTATNPCLLTREDMNSGTVEGGCNTTCDECAAALGTESEYLAEMATAEGAVLTSSQITHYTNEYHALIDECMEPCKTLTSCDVYKGMMQADLRPLGQYGLDATDGLSIFSPTNTLGGHWDDSGISYFDEFGDPAYISVNYDGTSYSPALKAGVDPAAANGYLAGPYQVDPKDLLNVSDFMNLFQFSWTESLLPYHPEYELYEYYVEICNALYQSGTDEISSETFDAILRDRIDTYAWAEDAVNPYQIDFIQSSYAIYDIDPYFQTTYAVHTNLGLSNVNYGGSSLSLKNALMLEAIDDYKNSGYSMLQYAIITVVYGNSTSPGTIPSTWPAAETAFPGHMDEIWQTYEGFYLSYKAQINQLLLDMHGFGLTPKLFNGCMGATGIDAAYVMTFQSSNYFLTDILPEYTARWGFGSPVNTWPLAFCGSAFQNKTARIVRVDNLYNAGLPVLATMTELGAEADYHQWEQTGLCPLMVDMERLLNGLAVRNELNLSQVMDTLPEMVPDLFEGITQTAFGSGSSLTISGSVSGSSLVLTFSNTQTTCSITLPELDPLNHTLPWSSYGQAWHIFFVGNSFPHAGTNDVSVLVRAGVDEEHISEYVITFTSCVNLNACQEEYTDNNQYSEDCQKEEAFEQNMTALMQDLFTNGQLFSTQGVDISQHPNYENTVIYDILNEETPMEWEYGSSSQGNIAYPVFSFGTGSVGFRIFFNTILSQGDISSIQWVNGFNIVGDVVYVSFMTTNGVIVKEGFIGMNDDNLALDLSCPCTGEANAQTAFEGFFNYLVTQTSISCGSQPQALLDLAPYLNLTNPQIQSFSNTTTGIVCTLAEYGTGCEESGTCELTLAGTQDPDLTIISLHDFVWDGTNFTCTADLSPSGKINDLAGSAGCMLFESDCDTCHTQPQMPLSCTYYYDSYTGMMNQQFIQYISDDDPNVDEVAMFTEEYMVSQDNFCSSYYAYIFDAYQDYLESMEVTDVSSPYYLSLAEFGSTPVGYSNALLDAIILPYSNYVTAYGYIEWNEYVSEIYLAATPVCPAFIPGISIPADTLSFPCDQWEEQVQTVNGNNQYDIYLQQTGDAFVQAYIEAAMASLRETFEEDHPDKEYHYTLYYYDRAGNLVQTVPPAGVRRMDSYTNAATTTEINDIRVNNPLETAPAASTQNAPQHFLATRYRYNSLNQLVYQNTPDGGESYFAYDKLGRLVISQNAKQAQDDLYSYTRYDGLGRVAEVGELTKTGLAINSEGKLVSSTTGAEIDVNASNFPDNISTVREQVTRSVYDELAGITIPVNTSQSSLSLIDVSAASAFGASYGNYNTRNRIVAVVYQETYDASINEYDNGTFYNYDVHGNVQTLIQVNNEGGLQALNQHIKQVDYEYDLVSGNVNRAIYQKDQPDQFIHRYEYDADNRLIQAETSEDGVIYEKEAKYFYYDHGPLARVEIGDKKVQATDYAYTIQGWLKAVNGEQVNPETSMGADGIAGNNAMIGRDAFGFSLSYYENDYDAANTGMLGASSSTTVSGQLGASLYNGNIRSMVTALSDLDEQAIDPHHTAYEYDQLNRIVSMYGRNVAMAADGTAAGSSSSGYSSSYSYDANGNLQTLQRYAFDGSASVLMDNFTYEPVNALQNNQLDHVADNAVTTTTLDGDIEPGQVSGNYTYDAIGQLTQDEQEGIAEIEWTVTKKVREVTYGSGKTIRFEYDAMGHRISKEVTPYQGGFPVTDYYVLDAQGNPMSIYQRKWQQNDGVGEYKLYLSERSIYGFSRLGTEELHREMAYREETAPQVLYWEDFTTATELTDFVYQVGGPCATPVNTVNGSGQLEVTDACPTQYDLYLNTVAGRQYSFSAYLDGTNAGNFFVQLFSHSENCANTLEEVFVPFTNGSTTSYDFTATTSCTRISYKNYDGGTFVTDNIVFKEKYAGLESGVDVYNGHFQQEIGDKRYQLSNHLGNVLEVITDRKLRVQEQAAALYENDFSSTYAPIGGYLVDNIGLEYGRLKVEGAQMWGKVTLVLSTVPGTTYQVSYDVDLAGAGILVAFTHDPGTAQNLTNQSCNSNGSYTYSVQATGTTTYFMWENEDSGNSPRDFYLDNIEITPELPVLMQNDFSSTDAPFTAYGSSTNITGGTYNIVDMPLWGTASFTETTEVGHVYEVSFDADLHGATNVRAYARESNYQTAAQLLLTADGSYSYQFTAQTTSVTFIWQNEDSDNQPRDLSLDNVLVKEINALGNYFLADVVNYSDYYPFGMQMPGRKGSDEDYRYGFNGMEGDDEVKGEGNSYDFGARMYDPRVGRWLSRDPLARQQPDQSPYKAFYNNPIKYVDPNGQTEYESVVTTDERTGKTMTIYITKSNKLKTDGEVKFDGSNLMPYQEYYDYRHVTYITIHKDGTRSQSTQTTEILKRNGVKYTDMIPMDYIFGNEAKKGSIYDPDDPFVQAGGFYMTGKRGQGTKYHSTNADYVGDIDKLISIMSNYSTSPKLHIPKELTKGDAGWKAVEQLIKTMDRQGTTVKKINEVIKAIQQESQGSGGEKDNSDAGSNPNKTPSNKTYWSKPEGSKNNVGTGTIATPEEMKNGDTLGGNKQINIYPQD